jgi:hypothetical protein
MSTIKYDVQFAFDTLLYVRPGMSPSCYDAWFLSCLLNVYHKFYGNYIVVGVLAYRNDQVIS